MDCGIDARILKCIVLCLAMGYVLSGLIEITYCKHILALDPIMFIINVFLIPYIGCYGALKDKKYALVLFVGLEVITFLVLAINLIDEIGIWSLNFGDLNQCKHHLEEYVLDKNPEVQNLLTRTEIQCCGVYGPWDYGNATLPMNCCRKNSVRCQNADIVKTGCIEVCKDIHNIQEEIKIILLINSVLQCMSGLSALRLASLLPKEKLAQKTFV